jgi:hypothetical protein
VPVNLPEVVLAVSIEAGLLTGTPLRSLRIIMLAKNRDPKGLRGAKMDFDGSNPLLSYRKSIGYCGELVKVK